MKCVLCLLALFSFAVQAAPMMEDGANVGELVGFVSDYNQTAQDCLNKGYRPSSDCLVTDVAEGRCPHNQNYISECVPVANYRYGKGVQPCQRVAGHSWRGRWTECLD